MNNYNIPTILQQVITAEQAHHYQIVPEKVTKNALIFKTVKKNTVTLAKELSIILGKEIVLKSIEKRDFIRYLSNNYRLHKKSIQEELKYSDDFLMQLISEAKAIGSSDVHLEVFQDKARARFRIDGKLLERYLIPKGEYPILVNRLKILAQLDISEKRLPQDGRIQQTNGLEKMDIRISVLPTLHGEKVVLRLLAQNNSQLELSALGFSNKAFERYQKGIQKPNGIVLISGPTGSGKTTTLYATLKRLNTEKNNILTIEDPIEYTLEGINQVQVKPSIGLDFSTALRTILRQDPDIIMVGEIRDKATADMAVRAALTGHLVFSTLHTNSAWDAIARMIDLEVPPFLLKSTLQMTVAQRLIRKLCVHCKTPQITFPSWIQQLDTSLQKINKHFTAEGCEACYYTGYQGRKAIYEIIPITAALKPFIQNKNADISSYLSQENINNLQKEAWKLVVEGSTSLKEIYPFLV